MFKSLSSWFTSKDAGSSRKNLAMTSTHDAFSSATHSPTFPPQSSPYATRAPSSDNYEGDTATDSSYTYPPQTRGDIYNYVPHSAYEPSRETQQKSPSLLPLYRTTLPPLPSYPPLSSTWNRIRAWLLEEYAELGDTLNWGTLPATLQQVELTLGYALPSSVRESYLITDGQEPESLSGFAEGLFFGLTFLTLENALEEWKFWRDVDEDSTTGANSKLKGAMQSVPRGHIRCEYSERGWFPLITDKTGNYVGVDMNPDKQGTSGQVIVFGRDFDMKVVLSSGEGEGSWGRWLANFAEELEAGDGFEMGSGDGSEGSDDGVGYESYFFDGSGSSGGQGGAHGGRPGMRLTGNYRGWPVLEAWADRSFRQWQEVRITSPQSELPEKDLPIPPSNSFSTLESRTRSTSNTEAISSMSSSTPDDTVHDDALNNQDNQLPVAKPLRTPTQDITRGSSPSILSSSSALIPSHTDIASQKALLQQHDHPLPLSSMLANRVLSRHASMAELQAASLIPLPPDRSPIDEPIDQPIPAEVAHSQHTLLIDSIEPPAQEARPQTPPNVPSAEISSLGGRALNDPKLQEATEHQPLVPISTVRLVGIGGKDGSDEVTDPAVSIVEEEILAPQQISTNSSHKKKGSGIANGLRKINMLGAVSARRKVDNGT